MTFTRRVENFKCRHCGKSVKGNGFTNHCPYCLWSRHVDIDPGDRMEVCRGMMEPIDVEADGKEYYITHKCSFCGAKKRNKTAQADDINAISSLIR